MPDIYEFSVGMGFDGNFPDIAVLTGINWQADGVICSDIETAMEVVAADFAHISRKAIGLAGHDGEQKQVFFYRQLCK